MRPSMTKSNTMYCMCCKIAKSVISCAQFILWMKAIELKYLKKVDVVLKVKNVFISFIVVSTRYSWNQVEMDTFCVLPYVWLISGKYWQSLGALVFKPLVLELLSSVFLFATRWIYTNILLLTSQISSTMKNSLFLAIVALIASVSGFYILKFIFRLKF